MQSGLAADSLSFPDPTIEELPAALHCQMDLPVPMEPTVPPDQTELTQVPTSSAATAGSIDTSTRSATDKVRMVPPWWMPKENHTRTRALESAQFSLTLLPSI